ncbi:MAG: molybdenum cofactor guanylyltransferase [Bacteroidota bacterium]
MKITVVILAGGRSSRMGSNKALIPYLGKPLIQYSLDLAKQFTQSILISAGNHDLAPLGFPMVKDVLKVSAPIAGIHSGLLNSRTAWTLVLTCDMPNVSIMVIDRLISAADHDLRMVVPRHADFIEPLCGFYHRELIPVIENNVLSGKMSLLDLPGIVPHKMVDFSDIPSGEISHLFKNVNERKDLLP